MEQKIKNIVEACGIDEKRTALANNKIKLFKLERMMAEATFNRNVGLYAAKIDQLVWIMENGDYDYKLHEEIRLMETDEEILAYKRLQTEFHDLMTQKGEYEKAVNIDLRLALTDIIIPNIYIEQKDNFKNILNPNITELNEESIIISPVYEVESNRLYRHFYNKTSFHYLEELSKDYNYELEKKNIGKVKIKKM